MKTTILICSIVLGLILVSTASNGAVVVIPSNPLSTQAVQIQVVNQYTSEAAITSATIVRNGNQFVINQTVDLVCLLPAAPILTSYFDVGVLQAGAYQVIAQIQHTSSLPGCGGYTVNQSANFNVIDAASVPAGDFLSYLIVACLLAFFGMRRLMSAKWV